MKNILYVLLVAALVFCISVAVKRGHHQRHEGTCLHARSKVLSLSGAEQASQHIPQCTIYGNYFLQQCDKKLKQCWCVSSEGQKLEATITPWGDGKQPEACKMNAIYRWYRDLQ